MKINYEELKIGQKYFITDPQTEKIQECLLTRITTQGEYDEEICYAFKYLDCIDKDGDKIFNYIYLNTRDGKEIFDGEFIKIEIYNNKEEAEINRVRLIVDGDLALIEDYKKDIAELEEKILKLKADSV